MAILSFLLIIKVDKNIISKILNTRFGTNIKFYTRISPTPTLPCLQVVLARYGEIFRGNKVKNAADAGALAIVLFKDLTDPGSKDRFPLSEFAPSSSGERGTVGLSVLFLVFQT